MINCFFLPGPRISYFDVLRVSRGTFRDLALLVVGANFNWDILSPNWQTRRRRRDDTIQISWRENVVFWHRPAISASDRMKGNYFENARRGKIRPRTNMKRHKQTRSGEHTRRDKDVGSQKSFNEPNFQVSIHSFRVDRGISTVFPIARSD